MASAAAIVGETMNRSTRITRKNKKLTYQLNIIQQPERARACGAGAKSHADRRPVDPPPVVQLQIFQGDEMNDVTFSHNANFFLYATLEAARPIAQGRLPPAATSIPVLTGVFVSGMAYLDRPTPAGYFIFPDLSVRNEGKYRLSFNLYEEVKESDDADMEPAPNHPDHPSNKNKMVGPMAPKQHVDWRLEVKSKPFTVFSAKKFPGLAESTALSRIVAEQGCRVRIRRDVRMRRRENKGGREVEEYEEEGLYQRTRKTPTPEIFQQPPPVPHQPVESVDRQRSASDATLGPTTPYDVHRRLSVHEQQQQQQQQFYSQQTQYQQQYTAAPSAPQPAYNGISHLQYGNSAVQYQTPTVQTSQPPQQVFPQGRMTYHPPQQYGYPTERQAPMALPSQQLQQHQNMQPHPVRHENGDYRSTNEFRRLSANSSVTYVQQPAPSQAPPTSSSYPMFENGYGRPPASYQPQYNPPPLVPTTGTPTPTINGNALPPLKMPLQPIEPRYDSLASPAAPTPNARGPPPLASPGYESGPSRNNSYGQYPTDNWSRPQYPQPPVGPVSAVPEPARTSKRPYDAVFGAAHLNQPLHNGMRPGTSFYNTHDVEPDYDDTDCGSFDTHKLRMEYKRADGSAIRRQLPSIAD